jgi:heme exporter protein B
MLWAALLFAGVGTLTRAFVSEEEQGTGDLLRMWARPHAVYWGKVIFAFLQMALTSLVVAVLFLTLTGVVVTDYVLLGTTLLGGSAALSGMVTLVSALISRGSNRSTLGGVVVMPLMIPLIALGVSGVRSAIEGTQLSSGWMSCLGVWEYTIAVLALAPFQFASVWGEP